MVCIFIFNFSFISSHVHLCVSLCLCCLIEKHLFLKGAIYIKLLLFVSLVTRIDFTSPAIYYRGCMYTLVIILPANNTPNVSQFQSMVLTSGQSRLFCPSDRLSSRTLSTRLACAVNHCNLWPWMCQPSSALQSSCQHETQQDTSFHTFFPPLLFPVLSQSMSSSLLPSVVTVLNLQGTFKWILVRVIVQLANVMLRKQMHTAFSPQFPYVIIWVIQFIGRIFFSSFPAFSATGIIQFPVNSKFCRE